MSRTAWPAMARWLVSRSLSAKRISPVLSTMVFQVRGERSDPSRAERPFPVPAASWYAAAAASRASTTPSSSRTSRVSVWRAAAASSALAVARQERTKPGEPPRPYTDGALRQERRQTHAQLLKAFNGTLVRHHVRGVHWNRAVARDGAHIGGAIRTGEHLWRTGASSHVLVFKEERLARDSLSGCEQKAVPLEPIDRGQRKPLRREAGPGAHRDNSGITWDHGPIDFDTLDPHAISAEHQATHLPQAKLGPRSIAARITASVKRSG